MSARRVHGTGAALRPAWAAAVAGFREHLASSERSPETAESYVRHIEWLACSSVSGPWVLRSQELGDWLSSQNWSLVTRRKVTTSLRAFYGWAVADGYVEWAPTAGLARPVKKARMQRLPLPAAWDGPVHDYLTACRGRSFSEGTIAVQRMYLRRLAEVAADPWAVQLAQLEQWLAAPDWAPETRRCARSVVRGFYRWAERACLVEKSPAVDLPAPRLRRALPRPAGDDALEAGLAACDDRVRLMILLGAYAGLRRAEIASLECSQIRLDYHPAHLMIVGKGGHERVVPLDRGSRLEVALRSEFERRQERRPAHGWRGDESEAGWLFPCRHRGHGNEIFGPLSAEHVGKLISRQLPPGVTAHQLRHRFASEAYKATRDLLSVQVALGHQKPETTARYAAVPDGGLLAVVRGAAGEWSSLT